MKWMIVLIAALGCAEMKGGDSARAPGPMKPAAAITAAPRTVALQAQPTGATVHLRKDGYREQSEANQPAPVTLKPAKQQPPAFAGDDGVQQRVTEREAERRVAKEEAARKTAEVRDLEQRTEKLKEKVFRSKAHLSLLKNSADKAGLEDLLADNDQDAILDAEDHDEFMDSDGEPDLADAKVDKPVELGNQFGGFNARLDSGEHTVEVGGEIDRLSRQARIIPSYKNGKPRGFKIAGVRASSTLGKIGLKSGDVIVAIDGKAVTSPDKALAAYGDFGKDRTVSLEIERDGRPRSITVRLRGGQVQAAQDAQGLHTERWRIGDAAWLGRPELTQKPDRFLPRMFYFENTYLGRTAAFQERLRRLDSALGAHDFEATTLDPQQLDPPADAGISVTTALDRQHLEEPGRVILQVALQGSQRYGWRRPPLDMAVVLDPLVVAHAPRESKRTLDRLLNRLGPKDRLGVVLATNPPRVLVDVQDLRAARAAILNLDGRVRATGVNLAAGMRAAGDRLLAASEGQARVPGSQTLVVLTAGEQSPDAAARIAHDLTVQGAVTSVIDLGGGWDWWAVANAGHGQLYSGRDVTAAVDGELERVSKVVARLLRVNIKLADGVEAIRVLGSRMLEDDEVKAVKAREVATDLQISKTMGVKADRGDDDDGIQTVIPFFHGGDAHVIMVELWVDKARRSMPVADVTLRYKDMVALSNATARSHVSLSSLARDTTPAELLVRRNVRGFELAEALGKASVLVARGDDAGARRLLDQAVVGSSRDRALVGALQQLLGRSIDTSVKRAALAYAGQRRISHVAMRRR